MNQGLLDGGGRSSVRDDIIKGLAGGDDLRESVGDGLRDRLIRELGGEVGDGFGLLVDFCADLSEGLCLLIGDGGELGGEFCSGHCDEVLQRADVVSRGQPYTPDNSGPQTRC